LCPVAGHNHHGQVEARIKTVQDAMDKMGIYQERLHATGLQTTLKLIESDMNSTPLGVTMGRSSCNTPMLKLIAPDHLRLGRISNRIPAGPFKLPDSPQDMITCVDELYWRWHQIFNDTMLPALLITDQPKWFNHDTDLKVDDVVYFKKTTGVLRSPWALGLVHEVDIGRDGLIRMVTVRYFNSTEPSKPQYTDRAVRSLVRLFHIDELSWAQDMDRVRYICQKFNLPLAPDTQPPASPNINCGCCHGSHRFGEGFVYGCLSPLINIPIHNSLPTHPTPDSIPLPEPETPDDLLDVGARDEHTQLEGGFMANLLTLGALPSQDCLPF
jgi:hypothetical protein